jgi:hypothetical protein
MVFFFRLIVVLFLSIPIAQAQISLSPQVYSTAGTVFQNNQFHITYTVGEMSCVSTVSSGNSILTQGFNQPDKFTVASIQSTSGPWVWSVFPNPADQELLVRFNAPFEKKLFLKIVDALGRLVLPEEKFLHSGAEWIKSIDVSAFASGVYFVHLSSAEGEINQIIPFTRSHR